MGKRHTELLIELHPQKEKKKKDSLLSFLFFTVCSVTDFWPSLSLDKVHVAKVGSVVMLPTVICINI